MGIFLPSRLRGPLLVLLGPGTSPLLDGWSIEREKAGWDRQGQAAGVAAGEDYPGQSAHEGLC